MQPFNCPRCKMQVRSGAQFCEQCGLQLFQPPYPPALQQQQDKAVGYKVMGYGCLGLVLMIGACTIVGSLATKQPTTSRPTAVVQETSKKSADPDSPAPSPRSPAVRIDESVSLVANAKSALADGYKPSGKDKAWGRVKDARLYLEQVRPEDKQYKEAQKLLSEVARREREIEAWSRVAARELFIEMLERSYLEKGMDVTLSLSGPDKTTMTLKYILMSRPLVYQLSGEGDFMNSLRKMGIRKVIFTDGYYNRWNVDVD